MARADSKNDSSYLSSALWGGPRNPFSELGNFGVETLRASAQGRRVSWTDTVKAAKACAVLGLSAAKLGEGLVIAAEIIITSAVLTRPFIYSQFGLNAEPIQIDVMNAGALAVRDSAALLGFHYLQTKLQK